MHVTLVVHQLDACGYHVDLGFDIGWLDGELGVEVVDAVSISCQQRGFLCCGGGGCNSYALDLAATLEGHHFKFTHF